MSTTTSEQVYRGIRGMLSDGQLRPGGPVSQTRLAEQLGCSTFPVVEAMRRLESEGLLVKQPHKIARVRKLSLGDLEELYILREGLEAAIVRFCARRITDQEITELKELSLSYEAVWEEGVSYRMEQKADAAIHEHIAKCARVPLLSGELSRLMLLKQTAGRMAAHDGSGPGHPHSHRALIQALVDRDADLAEYMMRKHIQRGYQESLTELGSEDMVE